MTRIFSSLAALNATGLLLTFAVGILSFFRSSAHRADDSTYLFHFALGLFFAIFTLLVHCIIFTYFLGTGRWVKEVGLAYGLPDDPLPRITRELKRQTFPVALTAMLVTIATAAAGAGVQLKEWTWHVHGSLAVATLLVNAWAFRMEYRNVRTNARIIEQVLDEVEHIRARHGLPSNADSIRQEDS